MIPITRRDLFQWLGTEDPDEALAPQYWCLDGDGASPPLTLGVYADGAQPPGIIAEFYAGGDGTTPLRSFFRLHASPVSAARMVIDAVSAAGRPLGLADTRPVRIALLRFREASAAMRAAQRPDWPGDDDSGSDGLGPPPGDGTAGGLGLPPAGGTRGTRAGPGRRRFMPAGRPHGPG